MPNFNGTLGWTDPPHDSAENPQYGSQLGGIDQQLEEDKKLEEAKKEEGRRKFLEAFAGVHGLKIDWTTNRLHVVDSAILKALFPKGF